MNFFFVCVLNTDDILNIDFHSVLVNDIFQNIVPCVKLKKEIFLCIFIFY